jgi:hypothetical protein
MWPIYHRIFVVANFCQSLASYFLATLFIGCHTFMASYTFAKAWPGIKYARRLEEIYHSMKAATRQIVALPNAIDEIAADEVDEEAGIPYSCPAQCRHSHHNDNVG